MQILWYDLFNSTWVSFSYRDSTTLLGQPSPPSHCINEIFEFTADDGARENPWKKTVTGGEQLLPEQIMMPVEGVVAQSQAPEAGAAQSPFLALLPSCCVSSGTRTYRVSPLENECVDISQIPIKASRALASFIISSSLRPFWDLECGKWNQWSKPCNLTCQNHINTHIYSSRAIYLICCHAHIHL